MAVIIPFEEIVQSRRRRRERESLQQCLDIVRLNIEYYQLMMAEASSSDRAVLSMRIERLVDLLAYGERFV